MSGENRRIINPLLNASVTGGTIEDFAQNAVLHPAAILPPISESEIRGDTNFYTHAPLQQNLSSQLIPINDFNQPEQQIEFENIISQPKLSADEYQPQAEGNQSGSQQYQQTFQSVFSTFSSYLKLGPSTPEQETTTSVVDSVLRQTPPNVEVVPVPLYSPTDLVFASNQNPPAIQAIPTAVKPPIPISRGTTNTYRRGGLKRPTYAPIPGLSSNTSPPNTPPQLPQNLPPQPLRTHSPLTPFTIRSSPLQHSFISSSNYFQPELSGYATPAESTISYPRPSSSPPNISFKPSLEKQLTPPSSPFLNPVPSSEAILTPAPIKTFISSVYNPNPTILTPSSYSSPHSSILTPIMPTMANNDVPRASSGVNSSYNAYGNSDGNVLPNSEQMYLYRPVYHHWFFKRQIEGKIIWTPFTMFDSLNLETGYLSNDLSPEKIVPTDGGRYDVNILRRERTSVYWDSPPSEVRRCSWFHKGNADGRYVPYEENIATKLEEEFKIAHDSSTWNRKVELPNGETVIFHGPDVLVLFPQTQTPDVWGNTPNQPRPRVVKRGMDEFHIDEGEPAKVDHLLFLVHGIGSVCDLKFRSVEEVVDEFRSISLQLVQSHYRSSCEKGVANRVEVLPISWHEKLHSDDTGVDKKLKGITLESIPKLREFANDTILDVLFYTSPVYCQTIISCVANELNRIYEVFKQRNPSFDGGVSLGGHSLGSLILFDILCHQQGEAETPEKPADVQEEEDVVLPLKPHPKQRQMSRRISYMMSAMGTGQAQLHYPHLNFNPKHFFALGSPIGMFVTVRGLDTLGEQFALPTCPAFYNIFHPYDPVAYRIESLINPELANLKPVLIPHHKGRKRMHLELKETMARVGADLKQKIIDSMKSTWNSFYQFSLFKSQNNPPNLEEEVDKVFEEQMNRQSDGEQMMNDENIEAETTDLSLGMLNQGKRIDYVLQEAPLEFFNEYIFALTSHVCYWESEDTMLLILKEIYNSMNISVDSQIPQQTMTIERQPQTSESSRHSNQDYSFIGVDPTMPMTTKQDLGPPPMTGFVRKS